MDKQQLTELYRAMIAAREIDRIERRFQQLHGQFKELKEKQPESFDPLDEKPPHY